MTQAFSIRDARPSDAPFLAECIFAGLRITDTEGGAVLSYLVN